MLRWYKADLHIHTVLSACAELSMGPRDIVNKALQQNLDIISITDHNSAENVAAVVGAAEGTDLTVIPGMEVSTKEEVHIICLFPDLECVLGFQDFIYSRMTEGKYDESFFGPQVLCDKDENVLGQSDKLLSFAIGATLDEVSEQVVKHGGLFYPAHVDRRSYSLLRVLGFIPSHLPIKAVEITHAGKREEPQIKFLEKSYSLITSSDAHDIDDLGKERTFFKLAEPSFAEIARAMNRQDGRMLSLEEPIVEQK
jgi:PHP family Zn ribbon phosphoesterase